ncbi:MAG: hypothetical protein WDN47_04595 [Candidatus Doudnabacteria bacterium]
MSTFRLPAEVSLMIGMAIPRDKRRQFWTMRNELLGNQSPQQIWRSGAAGRKKIREFILAAKSGDIT